MCKDTAGHRDNCSPKRGVGSSNLLGDAKCRKFKGLRHFFMRHSDALYSKDALGPDFPLGIGIPIRDIARQKCFPSERFECSSGKTRYIKMKVLQNIMNIAYTARMIGDYTGSHIDLYTEKVTGTKSVWQDICHIQKINKRGLIF